MKGKICYVVETYVHDLASKNPSVAENHVEILDNASLWSYTALNNQSSSKMSKIPNVHIFVFIKCGATTRMKLVEFLNLNRTVDRPLVTPKSRPSSTPRPLPLQPSHCQLCPKDHWRDQLLCSMTTLSGAFGSLIASARCNTELLGKHQMMDDGTSLSLPSPPANRWEFLVRRGK